MKNYPYILERKIFFLKAYTRAKLLSLRFKKIGKQVFIQYNCSFSNLANIEIGNYVYINHHANIHAEYEKIQIGNFVMIGPYTYIGVINHSYSRWDIPMYFQIDSYKKVVIEDDVWIGAYAFIMPGITIGRGSVIGAGAVVTKDVKPFSIVGGVPAKHIKYRFDSETIKKAKINNLDRFLNMNKKDFQQI